ncbi:hypothetical protein ACMGDM_19280 [Sphingomonas sp. DT-51]|uniref:hypothetical protein n=1 Tax=Sphingomonas sp. DT-51 TaxID=3396165 RepID=UPI003F1C0C5B
MIRFAALAPLLALIAPAPTAAETPDTVREHSAGTCKVSSYDDPTATNAGQFASRRSIVVQAGRNRILIAPVAGVDGRTSGQGVPFDAVLLTSLENAQIEGVMDEGRVRFPHARIFVDRAVLEDATRTTGFTERLSSLLASGRVYAIEANVDVLPGVRFAIPPTAAAGVSRVVVRCGDTRVVTIAGSELDRSGLGRTRGASLDRRDPAHLRRMVGDAYVLATTDGIYPAVATLYRHDDGFRLGSVEAREYGGVPPRTGRVIVETAAADRR